MFLQRCSQEEAETAFMQASFGVTSYTHPSPCDPGHSLNLYVPQFPDTTSVDTMAVRE